MFYYPSIREMLLILAEEQGLKKQDVSCSSDVRELKRFTVTHCSQSNNKQALQSNCRQHGRRSGLSKWLRGGSGGYRVFCQWNKLHNIQTETQT